MRAFRDPLILAACCVAVACNAQVPSPAAVWYPLAVGNTWTYACTLEGRPQFSKTVAIVAVEDAASARPVFRAEMRQPGSKTPLVIYLQRDAAGRVMLSYAPGMQAAEPLLGPQPQPGERVGAFTVRSVASETVLGVAKVPVARLENFNADDPKMPEEHRLGWRGFAYAQGVGLIEEADGTGAACALVKHRLRAVGAR